MSRNHCAPPPAASPRCRSRPRHAAPPPQSYRQRVTAIDKDARTVLLASGERLRYGKLLSTLPLDALLQWLGKGDWAAGLRHSSTHIVGIGLRGKW